MSKRKYGLQQQMKAREKRTISTIVATPEASFLVDHDWNFNWDVLWHLELSQKYWPVYAVVNSLVCLEHACLNMCMAMHMSQGQHS